MPIKVVMKGFVAEFARIPGVGVFASANPGEFGYFNLPPFVSAAVRQSARPGSSTWPAASPPR